jgi:putative component of membrane protein insertase Oxa1/YidC/SpoIIIJ protein YidD
MSQDAYEEWQRQDELWQQRLAAGEDPGPRTPPPAPPKPEPVSDGDGDQEEETESSGWKWLRRGGEAAWCASCGCGLLSGCDTSLLTIAMLAFTPSSRDRMNVALPVAGGDSQGAVPGAPYGVEFVDDATLAPGTRRALALLRGYKSHVSARTPNVCTQSVSCSAYAARAVRQVGTRRALPLIIARLRRCSAAAKGRTRA